MTEAELLLRFLALGQLAALIAAFGRESADSRTARYACLFILGLVGYVLCPPVSEAWKLGPVAAPVFLLCFSVAPLFWLFSRAWFEDRFRPAWPMIALLALPAVVGFARRYGVAEPDGASGTVLLMTHKLLSLGFVVWALLLARLGKPDDLVEGRRRLRDWFVGISSLYILVVVAFEIYAMGRAPMPVLSLVNISVMNLVLLAAVTTVLRPTALFERHRTKPAGPRGEGDPALRERLDRWLEEERGYREPGVTIGGLAETLGTQEYRLRRLINGHLGFRNFNDFLNHYRLRDAKQALGDPVKARLPVLTIAYDAGYNALSPFNRAFKQATGVTPVEYRRRALETGPAPEKV